ncbi:MAG: ATP-dependent Clp protease proteolytic subunit [Staphylococcus equorum]|nr:ATP-dependent Clp protease proteolytic subunit [Staphylococcus equorum]
MFQATVDDVIFNFLGEQIKSLSTNFDADIITIFSPMVDGVDVKVRQYIEDIKDKSLYGSDSLKDNLVVILETPGGSVEVVEKIVNVFRANYSHVKFIVPGFAFSAGTVLVLSGDEIYMDNFSVLGPIDPQIMNSDGHYLPATGYLHEYNRLLNEINEKASQNIPVIAEINYLTSSFQPEKLAFIEQHIKFSQTLIVNWLVKYKFKDWHTTVTEMNKVTYTMKEQRATDIATILGDVNHWHMHGRGIGLKELTGDDIKLQINNFSVTDVLNTTIRMYYDVLKDYLTKTGNQMALHGSNNLVRLN